MGLPKGRTNNPNGRPSVPEVQDLRDAIERVKKKKNGLSLLEHAIERAYISDPVLIAILKKIVPDKINLSGDLTQETNLSDKDRKALAVLAKSIVKAKTGIS